MLSRDAYTGDGSTAAFSVTFAFDDPASIHVSVDGVDATFTWTGASQVTLDVVPAAGAAVVIYRETDVTDAEVVFTDAQVLTADNLNTAVTQVLRSQQEVIDIVDGAVDAAVAAAEQAVADAVPGVEANAAAAATAAATAAANSALALKADRAKLPINVKDYGAVGDGVTDDTAALYAAFGQLCDNGGGEIYFPKGTYLHGLRDLADIPASSWKTSLAGIQSAGRIGLPIVGVRGAKISGQRGAVLKRKDASCSDATNTDIFGWAQVFLYDALDVEICGFEIDGNRAGQTHTSALVSGSANHALMVFPAYVGGAMVDVKRVNIHHMRLRNAGTLMTSADKQGDEIYAKNGVIDLDIHHNEFEDWGRWAVTVERGYPTAGGYTPSSNIAVRHNVFRNGFKEAGSVQIGALDFETWEEFNLLTVDSNRFVGSCKMSIGSAPSTAVQTINGVSITNNDWDMRGQPSASTDIIISIQASWALDGGGAPTTRRRFVGLKVEGNRYFGDFELSQFLTLANETLDGVSVRNNQVFVADASTLTADAMIRLASIALRGECVIADNRANNKAILLNVTGFQDDLGNELFRLDVGRNALMNGNGAIRFTGPTHMLSSTGTVSMGASSATITGSGTKFRKELRVGGQLVAGGKTFTIARIASDTSATATTSNDAVAIPAGTTFTRSPGVVTFDGNAAPTQLSASGSIITANNAVVRWGRSNALQGVVTLTNVLTPGRGSAVIASGTTSIVVQHGLGNTPTNISVTPVSALGAAAKWWVSGITSTTFTINVDVNPAAAVTFNWSADGPNG